MGHFLQFKQILLDFYPLNIIKSGIIPLRKKPLTRIIDNIQLKTSSNLLILVLLRNKHSMRIYTTLQN